jgi:hypothetical protein
MGKDKDKPKDKPKDSKGKPKPDSRTPEQKFEDEVAMRRRIGLG